MLLIKKRCICWPLAYAKENVDGYNMYLMDTIDVEEFPTTKMNTGEKNPVVESR